MKTVTAKLLPILLIILSFMLIQTGCVTTSGEAGSEVKSETKSAPVATSAGKKLYTQVNIWYEKPMNILATNYHVGSMIPAGTKVTIDSVDRSSVEFTDGNGTKFRIVIKLKHNNVPGDKLVELWFGPNSVSGKMKKFNKNEKENIKAGYIAKGMSKEAVIMAYGYPPTIRTQSIEQNIWTYWKNRWVTQVVRFDKNKVVEVRG